MNGLELRQISHDDLDIIERSLRHGYYIDHQQLGKLFAEVKRLHEIENHLCVVAVDGKFSHYIDGRQPEHRKKFNDALEHQRMKLDVRFERMDNRMCSQCNDPAHTLLVRRERANGRVAGRCMRDDCEASRCLQEIKE